jgi:hypothetical protein
MKNPTIFVAKYAPSIERMEPRNVGVVVWTPENLVARFLGEQPDGRVVSPAIVPKESRHAYREWISYWRLSLAKPSIQGPGGRPVLRSSPEFMEALRSKSKASFMLCEAGYIKDKVSAVELPAVVDEYFDILVKESTPEQLREHKRALRKGVAEALGMVNIDQFGGGWQNRVPVRCKIGTITRPLIFDHALLANKLPTAVFQRVLLPQQASICQASFMFDKIHVTRGKKPAKCAFVLSDGTDIPEAASDNLRVLTQFANVIDVANPGQAARQIENLMLAA